MRSRIGGALARRLAPFLFRQTVRMRNARPLVSFTFDDAPRSAGTTGAGILEASGACGTYYVLRRSVRHIRGRHALSAVERPRRAQRQRA